MEKKIISPNTKINACECAMNFVYVPLIHRVQSGQWQRQETNREDKGIDEKRAIQETVEEYR
jgi:hypothetical protein